MAAANAVLPEPIGTDVLNHQAAAAAATTRLDLNSPPPPSGSTIIASNTSSSSSSNSPSRSEISSSCVSMSAAAAAAAPVAPTKKAGSSSSPAEAEAIKQQLAATTFIQADVMNFREVVQKHTGAAEDAQDKMPVTVPARQAGGSKHQQQNQQNQQNGSSAAAAENGSNKAGGGGDPPPAAPPRRHSYKLHERKQKNIHNLDIVRQTVSPFKRPGCSPRGGEAGSSPKLLYDPLLVSPVTPLSGEAFETSNPPLTPTEQLRQSFAASLHCCEDNGGPGSAIRVPGFTPATTNGHHHHHGAAGVLDRFPFLQSPGHHGVHNVVVHQQQQNGNHHHHHHQQHHHGHVLSPVLGNHHHHHILQQNHPQQQQPQHFVYEQQQQQQQQQIPRTREPELLDLFPVHSPRLKETQGTGSSR